MAHPQLLENTYYELLHTERIDEFNHEHQQGRVPLDALRGGDFRGLVLKGLNVEGLDLGDAYFRGADLRGIDFSTCNLVGASIAQAHIAGCYFPANIDAYELRLSFDLGTRLRARLTDK